MKTVLLSSLAILAASFASAEPVFPQKDLFGAVPSIKAYVSQQTGTDGKTRVEIQPSQGVIARTRIEGQALGMRVETTSRHWNWLIPTLYEARVNGNVRNRMEPAKIEIVADNWPTLQAGASITVKVTDEKGDEELVVCDVRPAIAAKTLNAALTGEAFPIQCVSKGDSVSTLTHFLMDYGFAFTSAVETRKYELLGIER